MALRDSLLGARSSRSLTSGTSQDGIHARRPLSLCTAAPSAMRLEQEMEKIRSDVTFEISPLAIFICGLCKVGVNEKASLEGQKEIYKSSPTC